MDRTVCASPEDAAEACAQHMLSILGSAEQALLAVSGGSTPKLLFDRLASKRFEWQRVHLFWVDERAVPPDQPESNYRLAQQHLIVPAGIPEQNIHRIHGELSPEEAAERYRQEITEYFRLRPGELPHFDLIHLGMGPDAHTASLFPGDSRIDDRQGIADAVFVDKLSMWRITLLPGVILAARHVVMLVAGADKAQAVHEVFKGPVDLKRYPAQILRERGQVNWFMDRSSARLLD